MDLVGYQSLTNMISHIVFILITWRLLQAINLDGIIKKGRIFEARVLLMFLTITIGTAVSNFFLDYLQWSQNLKFLL
ncbi:membrane protein [Pontibacillus chungwhensis BH030062]|uniref:Membrane protein n=2 Tax=Pontibacillus TaxID=289201 RepID=A0A0A2VFN8_9BACI|nr:MULTISPECIES: DUF1146 family protein [Pontibacillus]KGP92435.1 membrane protein [Pontibacillus chungwhensis BH030062]QSS99827.1 DUF1146 domain-containing protein [Pontibacillus sp. ALD_SL1]GGD00476.1 putative membrane protein YwzB [Pontibacillus salipaludis]